MVRTQIQLPESVHRRLKRWARKRGLSLSEAVRRGISILMDQDDVVPDREELVRNALAACGRFKDPRGPVALGRDHDAYLKDTLAR